MTVAIITAEPPMRRITPVSTVGVLTILAWRLARPRRAAAGSNDLIRRAAAAIAMAVFGLPQVVSQGTQEQRKRRMAAAAVVLRQPCCPGSRAPCLWSSRAAVLCQQGVAPVRPSVSGGLHGPTAQHTKASAE